MQGAHHVDDLLAHGCRTLALRVAGGVGGLRREIAQRGVSPVVGAAALLQEQLVLLGLDRQQLDGGHAQPLEIGERGGVRQTGVGAAQLRRQPRGVGGEPLDVQLVDHGFAPRDVRVAGLALVLGLIAVVDRHRHRHLAQRIDRAHRTPRRSLDLAVHDVALVGERRRIQLHAPVDAFAVRVDEELVRVEPHAVLGIPGAVHTEAVAHAVPCLGQVHVPQTVVRAAHAEQRLAQIQGFDDARGHGVVADLRHERRARIVHQADRLIEESRGASQWFDDAHPYLIGVFGSDHNVGSTIVGEVESRTRGIAVQCRVLHTTIVRSAARGCRCRRMNWRFRCIDCSPGCRGPAAAGACRLFHLMRPQ